MNISLRNQRSTLAQSVNALTGKKTKEKRDQKTGSRKIVLPVLLLINGASLGYVSGNCLLIPILGVGFCSMQFVRKNRKPEQSLKTVLVAITNSYLTSEDIKAAVETCMPVLPNKYQPDFSQFLKLPVQEGLSYMRDTIKIPYIQKWCDVLCLCQQNFSLNPLLSVVLQEQTETEISLAAYLQSKKRICHIFTAFSIIFFLVGTGFLLFLKYKGMPITNQGEILIAVNIAIYFWCFYVIRSEAKEVRL